MTSSFGMLRTAQVFISVSFPQIPVLCFNPSNFLRQFVATILKLSGSFCESLRVASLLLLWPTISVLFAVL